MKVGFSSKFTFGAKRGTEVSVGWPRVRMVSAIISKSLISVVPKISCRISFHFWHIMMMCSGYSGCSDKLQKGHVFFHSWRPFPSRASR